MHLITPLSPPVDRGALESQLLDLHPDAQSLRGRDDNTIRLDDLLRALPYFGNEVHADDDDPIGAATARD